MKIPSLRLAIPFLFVFAVASTCPSFASDLSPLSANWKNMAYYGLLTEIRPRHPDKMKFLFLGTPTPCTYGHTSGYGGFVEMRKKSILWFQGSESYFYLVDADGKLRVLKPVNDVEESSVSPQMVTVNMIEKQVWVDPPTYTTTVPNEKGGWDTYDVPSGPGYYDTVIEKQVNPILAPGESERRAAFRKAKFTWLPHCQ